MVKIWGKGNETYLYLSGIGVKRKLHLTDNIELLPAHCSPPPDDIIQVSKSEIDLGITAIFLRQVKSQLHITAENEKTLAILAWNSLWYAVLLSALFDCEAVCNIQCDQPAENFSSKSKLEITNYHLRGLTNPLFMIEEEDASWIEKNFQMAWELLDKPVFSNAVHSLATYRWHSLPRARMAILWSGIEGLFDIQTEVTFRMSLYISRFLAPDDKDERKKIFEKVKKLYSRRSQAVHGSKIKGDLQTSVVESFQLLQSLVKRSIMIGNVPNEDDLVP